MKTEIAIAALLAGMIGVAAQPVNAKQPTPHRTAPARSHVVPATFSGPIPATAASHPLLDAMAALRAVGYVQEEFILSGKGNIYGWAGSSRQVRVVTGPADYATRILVWRPRDARRFSGNVEVYVLNASGSIDAGRPIDFGRMVKQGDVWIGVTTKAVAAKALQRFDPVRYAALNWNNPAPAARRCAVPSIIPTYMSGGQAAVEQMARAGMAFSSSDTEDGFVWDIMGHLAQLLKSNERQTILPGFGKPYLYMTGVSQSSLIVRTFAIAFRDRYPTADGSPPYDGYLAEVGPALLRLNQCEDDVPLQDARQKFISLDVPFISLSSEGEMWLARYTRQPDNVTARGGWISYEVAGGSHMAGEVPGLTDGASFGAAPADVAKASLPRPPMNLAAMGNIMPAGAKMNDLPWAPIARGAYHNLQRWVRQGVVPPHANPIAVDTKLEIRRDASGNAVGGIRTPYIDAPTATHTGYLQAGGGIGAVMGAKKPFTADELKRLYPEPAVYLARFSSATDRLLAGRWISPEDAEAMKRAAAAQAPMPK